MKNLQTILAEIMPQVETKTKKSVSQVFKSTKDELNREFKRLDKLVKAYFKLGLHESLYNDLLESESKSINKEIFARYFCFQNNDIGKFSSFLREVFSMPYFMNECNNLTPNQFVALVKKLILAEDGKVSKVTAKCNDKLFAHTFDFSDDIVASLYSNENLDVIASKLNYDDSYQIESTFNMDKFKMIFEAFI